MSESLTETLRQTYELASLRHMAERLQTGRQWEAAQDITARFEMARTDLTKSFADEYPARMAEARQKLILEATRQSPALTPMDASDTRFAKSAIEHKAGRMVRDEHRLEMAGLERAEAQELSQLMQRADGTNRVQGKAQQSFTQTASPSISRARARPR